MSSSNKSLSISRALPGNLTAYLELIDEILAILNDYGWSKVHTFGVHMALEESISNAVRHGNKHDPDKVVRVECEISEDRFYVKICDEGSGYNPNAVPDCCADENLEIPGGRGLALMRAYMNTVELTDNGKCVIMEKLPN